MPKRRWRGHQVVHNQTDLEDLGTDRRTEQNRKNAFVASLAS